MPININNINNIIIYSNILSKNGIFLFKDKKSYEAYTIDNNKLPVFQYIKLLLNENYIDDIIINIANIQTAFNLWDSYKIKSNLKTSYFINILIKYFWPGNLNILYFKNKNNIININSKLLNIHFSNNIFIIKLLKKIKKPIFSSIIKSNKNINFFNKIIFRYIYILSLINKSTKIIIYNNYYYSKMSIDCSLGNPLILKRNKKIFKIIKLFTLIKKRILQIK